MRCDAFIKKVERGVPRPTSKILLNVFPDSVVMTYESFARGVAVGWGRFSSTCDFHGVPSLGRR